MEKVAYGTPMGLDGISTLTVSGTERRWSMYHESFTVGLITAGSGRWRCRGDEEDFHRHLAMLIEPGDLHSTLSVDAPGSFCAFFMPPEIVRQLVDPDAADSSSIHFRDIAATDSATVDAFERLMLAIGTDSISAFGLSQLAAVALRTLFDRHGLADVSLRPAPSRLVRRTTDLIRAAYDADPDTPQLTVSSLASEVGVSVGGLIRGFRDSLGLTPHQFLLRVKTEFARRLIVAATNGGERVLNLTDIAAASGFYDLSHMGRLFRKLLGIRPREYALQMATRRFWLSAEKTIKLVPG